MSSDSYRGVNPDAGVGPYQTYAWSCIDLPAQCDGGPDCDGVAGPGLCSGVTADGRQVDVGCI